MLYHTSSAKFNSRPSANIYWTSFVFS